MGGGIEHLVQAGPLILAAPIAAAAGALTFLSPCVLPLVPGYLSYVTGMSGTDAQRAEAASERVAVAPDGTTVTAGAAASQAPAGPGPASSPGATQHPGAAARGRDCGAAQRAHRHDPGPDPARHHAVRARLLPGVRDRGPGLRRPGAGAEAS